MDGVPGYRGRFNLPPRVLAGRSVSTTCGAHGRLEPIAAASLTVARSPDVVTVHRDHAESAELVYEAVRLLLGQELLGCSSAIRAQSFPGTSTLMISGVSEIASGSTDIAFLK